jgi:hypothetical protein
MTVLKMMAMYGHVWSVYGPRMKFLRKFADQEPMKFFSLKNFFFADFNGFTRFIKK